MKKTFLYFVLFLISVNFLNAQVYEGDLVLTTQSEVDAFNYAEVTGDLKIGGIFNNYSDITNLNALISLTSVGGTLQISWTSSLTNLSGLSNLQTIGLGLIISYNNSLTNINGLSNVLEIGDPAEEENFIRIQNNQALTNIDGLSGVNPNFHWKVEILANPFLSNINGLSFIGAAYYIDIEANTSLTNINGLSNLTYSYYLIIQGNFSLSNVNGLSTLDAVHELLWIYGNHTLENVNGLSNLRSVGFYSLPGSTTLGIFDNPLLTNYDGLNYFASLCGLNGSYSFFGNGAAPPSGLTDRLDACANNTPPIANAGIDNSVLAGTTVQLNGSNSYDPDNNPLEFTWGIINKPLGSNATLSDINSSTPTFIADIEGEYFIRLRVYDTFVNSQPDYVTITAISIEDAIQEVDDMVQQLPLNEGNKNALSSKLKNALKNFSEGKLIPARNQLNAFLNQLYQFIADGKITQTDAQPLIDYANQIINAINASLAKEDDQIVTLPKDYSLHQNYPNPFNPSTTISWQSPIDGWQTLKVYDLLGREVATIVDEYRSAGSYELTFDASHLSSGMYLYKLITGDFVSTRKMLLMK